MRVVTEAERRARMARRHGLAPGHGYDDVATATRAMTALHATEAATVHLALHARVDGLTVGDVERALYEERSLVKQLAMRRTLWALPRDLLPAVWGSAAARVAAQQRAQLGRDVERAGITEDGPNWVDAACAAVLAHLADGEARPTSRIRQEVPELAGRVSRGTPEKKWGGESNIGPRVLTLLGAEGRVLRAANDGHWRLNRPSWTTTASWLGEVPAPTGEGEGYAELVRRWLWTFGPGTEADLVWWLGATKTATRRALSAVGAVPVELDRGETGWLLPDDPLLEGDEPPVEPWAALLPTLDPTVMGWKERAFYLDPALVPLLVDSNGNVGNTAWWDGRAVGAWAQDDAGVVRVLPCHELSAPARRALQVEAERLTAWLDGVRVVNAYASAQMKGQVLP